MTFNKDKFIEEKLKELRSINDDGLIPNHPMVSERWIEQSLNEAITQALESVRFVENPEGAHDESDAACDWMAEQLNQKIDAILKGEQ